MLKNIVLIGLSGSGKSTVGALLARQLGRDFVDTDSLIEVDAGIGIPELFAHEGEAGFRERETAALRAAMERSGGVIATGGGIVETPTNQELLRQALVVWLHGTPEALAERLDQHSDRPLLRDDPVGTLRTLLERRAARYAALADWVIAVDRLDATVVADEIRSFLTRVEAKGDGLFVRTPGGEYEVVVGPGVLAELPTRLQQLVPHGRAWIVSDDQVFPLHGQRLLQVLADRGVAVQHFSVPAGEQSKNLRTVETLYDWLLRAGVERGDVLLALGGGVVGDIAGFVASTVLRGIQLVQLPTNILSTVDSAIGGKTGVDHSAGKNLIGTFYQPRLVLADTSLLATLPTDDRRAGWAEAIKHGVIKDAMLFNDLVEQEPALRDLREPATSALLRRAASIKVAVVSGDEREQGERILLNYGHTIGHALEHWSSYRMRHGEAVAIGMTVAAAIARRVGLCGVDLEVQQEAALRKFGLPVRIPAEATAEALLEAARADKKVRHQRIRWVLPVAIGTSTTRGDIPDEIVLDALRERGAR